MRLALSFAGREKNAFFCLKFQGEVWAGRACAAANEKELTTLKKNWGQGGWAGGTRGQNRGAPAQARSSTAGRGG
jgi:hypothetical protein